MANDKQNETKRENERREAERLRAEARPADEPKDRDPRDEGVERGYANRHTEATEPGRIRRQEIPPEIEGDPEEVEREADRRREEGVERGYANRHAQVAGLEVGELPPLPPFTRPRTTAEPEGGYEAGYPKVYFSVYDRVPPIVVKTPNEESAIDKANFMTIPPEEVDPALTDAKMRAEWRVGDRAAERDLSKQGSQSAFSPVPGESERRDRSKEELDRLKKEQDERASRTR